MLSWRADFCSAVSWGCDGSSVNLKIDRGQAAVRVPTRRRRYFLYFLRSMGNLLKGPAIVEAEGWE